MSGAEVAVRKFAPTTLPERVEFARFLATAGMLPKAYRGSPGDILLAMEFGDSLGIPTVQAMVTINVIDGKPSASAALISALVRRAGHRLRVSGDATHAVATIVRSDDPDFEYRAEWNLARAESSGLVQLVDGKPRARSQSGKPLPWEAYPSALLKARAITEVARDACQEALMGVQYTPEELGAVVDAEGSPITVEPTDPKHRVDRNEPKPAAKAEPAEDIVDAEIVDEPAPAKVPLVLPDDFKDLVADCESAYDVEGLAALGSMAGEAGNVISKATATAAWKRVVGSLRARYDTDSLKHDVAALVERHKTDRAEALANEKAASQ